MSGFSLQRLRLLMKPEADYPSYDLTAAVVALTTLILTLVTGTSVRDGNHASAALSCHPAGRKIPLPGEGVFLRSATRAFRATR